MQYTSGQLECIELVTKFYKNWYSGKRIGDHPQYFSYSGPAGVGKTTVLKAIISELNLSNSEYICCAFSGKATLQIIRNNLPAQTFHSLIYRPSLVKVSTKEYYDEVDKISKDYYYKHLFEKTGMLSPLIKIIFVDEATMINEDMTYDLLSFGIPVVFIGDKNQLPPIHGNSITMDNPDFILTQIMRQHEDSPIIQLSQMVLNNQYIPLGSYGDCNIIDEIPYDPSIATNYDMVLVCKNKTRDAINKYIREEVHMREPDKIYLGDKVINRQNEREHRIDDIWLTNGTLGKITAINSSRTMNRPYVDIDFQPDFLDKDFENLLISTAYLTANSLSRQRSMKNKFMHFEYAYAITVHLSQGSEFRKPLFINESFHPDVLRSLRYTAITRAKESIDIVSPGGIRPI